MTNLTRDTAPTRAGDTTRDLAKAGVVLPEEVTAALGALQSHLKRGRPTPPDPDALATAYADAATDKALDALVALHVGGQAKVIAYNEASKRLGLRVMAALTSNGDAITRQLADLAAPLIDQLEGTAALSTLDVAALVRSGDAAGADLAARADVVAGSLSDLYRLRRAVTRGADYGIGGWDAGTWRNPRAIRQAEMAGTVRPTMIGAERYIAGIRAGGELWFPTPGEAETVAARLTEQDQRDELAERTAQHRRQVRVVA